MIQCHCQPVSCAVVARYMHVCSATLFALHCLSARILLLIFLFFFRNTLHLSLVCILNSIAYTHVHTRSRIPFEYSLYSKWLFVISHKATPSVLFNFPSLQLPGGLGIAFRVLMLLLLCRKQRRVIIMCK